MSEVGGQDQNALAVRQSVGRGENCVAVEDAEAEVRSADGDLDPAVNRGDVSEFRRGEGDAPQRGRRAARDRVAGGIEELFAAVFDRAGLQADADAERPRFCGKELRCELAVETGPHRAPAKAGSMRAV